MNTLRLLATIVCSLVVSQPASADFQVDASMQLKQSSGHECLIGYPCFRISNEYPQQLPPQEDYPWLSYKFDKQPEDYIRAVLKYVLEGNVAVDWDIARNPIRTWYHTPWMHFGNNGREPIHGLTRERGSRWHELSDRQTRRTNNWAVGFYNARGAFTIGQVWSDSTNPDSSEAQFRAGTVSAKLLFTDATDEEAPYLKSSKSLVWKAQINRGEKPVKLRLLQLDIAVRDSHADPYTGWVFGTFMFDSAQNGTNYVENLVPVGLQWGNDPTFTYVDYKNGSRPSEGWINPYVAKLFAKRPPDGDLGYLGRVNGPVDNPFSSCLACHGRAVDTKGKRGPDFTPQLDDMCFKETKQDGADTFERQKKDCKVKEKKVEKFFRNLKPNDPFLPQTVSLDYSLQLSKGIANWHKWFSESYPTIYERHFPSEQPRTKSFQSNRLQSVPEMSNEDIPTLPLDKAFNRGDKDL